MIFWEISSTSFRPTTLLHWLLQERTASRQAAGQTQAPAGNSSSISLPSWLFTVLPAKTVDHHEHPETQADHSTRAIDFLSLTS
jgi:hypothetical protein